MQIETERLLLRMFVPEEDAGTMYERIWTDPSVMRYVQPEGWPHPREESESVLRRVRAFFEEHGFGQWAVVDKTDRRLLGYCGLKFLDNTPEVELLYGIDKDYWSRGIVTEVARASLRFGFEEAGLDHIVAIALPVNVGSWRVMEKLGMRYEGMSRNYNFDVKRYAMRRDEFVPDPSAAYTLRRA
jgi:ribosomal-protein-alanine N-acetyltransferase